MNSPCNTDRSATLIIFGLTPPPSSSIPDGLWRPGSVEDQSGFFSLWREEGAEFEVHPFFEEEGADITNALRATHSSPASEWPDQGEPSGLHPNTACSCSRHDRHFDPTQGLWMTLDAVGFTANDTNLRRYVSNNPSTTQGEQAS
jgi:hypothetical protein